MMECNKIHRLFHNGAIKALHVLENEKYLLAGVGGYVELLDIETGNKMDQVHLFPHSSDSIHGFKEVKSHDRYSFLAYGGKSVSEFSVNMTENLGKIEKLSSNNIILSDWIMDCSKLGNSVHALTAHNYIIEYDTKTFQEIKVPCKDESCILYSGKLILEKNSANNTIMPVAIGGTVFKQIIIWIGGSGSNQGQLVHRLKGHEGVIFSVEFEPSLQLICSTSDDRSARLYSIPSERLLHDKEKEIHLMHVFKGEHSSRIFRSLFLPLTSLLVLAGEDGIASFWNFSQNEAKCIKKFKANDGSPLWSLSASSKYVYFGGGNGGIKKTGYQSLVMMEDQETVIQESVRTYPINLSTSVLAPDDYPNIVKFSKKYDETLIVVTKKGQVWKISTQKDLYNNRYQNLICQDRCLEDYTLLSVNNIAEEETIFLGTIDGKLKWIKNNDGFTELKSHQVFSGKIFALATLQPSQHILICGHDGEMKIFQMIGNEMLLVCDLLLPECKEQRWFSCAAETDLYLVIGDRCGNLHLYDRNSGKLLYTLPKVHKRHGIGCIEFASDNKYFITTGRDGFMCEFMVEEDDDEKVLRLVKKQHFKVNWMEHFHTLSNGTKCVLGFQSANFVIHSIQEGVNVVEIECGGGHRSWDFNGSDFVFIKDKQLMFSKDLISMDVIGGYLRNKGHDRVINCAAIIQCENGNPFVVTGSEDTTMEFWSVRSDGQLILDLMLRSHISSIKTIAIFALKSNKNEVILISAGGRAQLKVWRVVLTEEKSDNKNFVKLDVTELSSHLLKGNDKHRQKTWKSHDLIDDTETRYLSLQICDQDFNFTKKLVFVAACSDGIIRMFEFHGKKITLLKVTSEFSNAILKTTALTSTNTQMLLTANTIGELSVHDLVTLEILSQIKVHQSGINSVISNFHENLIISGGDDGSISISNSKTVILTKEGAHSGHVTGIAKINNNIFVSCSVDQRISVWKFDEKTNSLTLIRQIFSHVPDIQDMHLWKNNQNNGRSCMIIVFGNGIEVFEIYFK